MADKQSIKARLERFKTNPHAFVVEVLGAFPDLWQREALESIVKHDRIAIRSGHGVGKSAYLAWVILWWMSTRLGKVACTAPTAHQLQDVLWGELSKWYRKMPRWFQGQLSLKSERLEVVGAEAEAFAVARVSRKETPEAFQGFHSESMLFIVDEASGVDNLIFEVGQGAMSTAGAKSILTGNPTRTSGYFFDAFHRDRSRWHTIKVGCDEAKNVDPSFIQEMEEKYGSDSNIFRVRVLGEFADEGDDTVISLSCIESAIERDIEINPNSATVWGLDVSRFGSDRTALCKRKGKSILEPITTWQGKDLMQTCGLVMAEYKRVENFPDERPEEILVDSIGLGSGVCDRLAEMGLPARGINVSEAPSASHLYMRKRDELWFKAREWFQERDCKLPEGCDELVAELSVPHYEYTSSGKIKVEDKASMKKRGLRSPDIADAFCLSLAHESAFIAGHSFKSELPEMEVSVV
jgi:phage terminase large subunit